MITQTFYLSHPDNAGLVLELTGLAEDELESIVGRFPSDHWRWPSELKGEAVMYADGSCRIRHHFTKKTLWSNKE